MFRSESLFIGTSFTVAVFTIFATSNVDSIVGIPHKIYSMQRILMAIRSRSLCLMCPSAPRVCSEPGGQKPVLSLSPDLIGRAWPFHMLIYSMVLCIIPANFSLTAEILKKFWAVTSFRMDRQTEGRNDRRDNTHQRWWWPREKMKVKYI